MATRKRKRRVYSQLGLQVRAKRRRRLWRPRVRMAMPTRPNERWSIDFMSGQLVATSITGARLALFPDELGKAAAHPKAVVCDNGPELTSKAMRFWSERSGAALNFIQPGKPTQNAFAEGFNGKFRDSCLKTTGSGGSPTSGASWTTGATTATMSGRTAPWATRRPPNALSKPCLFTLLASGLVLGGGSGGSVQSHWQGAAEGYLINLFRPVWNNETDVCYGLGKHGDAPLDSR